MAIINRLTVAQTATLLNVIITFIQYTFGLALVLVLVHLLKNINSAITWSFVTRRLHSSLWPTLLRSDSVSTNTDARVSSLSWLAFISAILIAATGIVTPLGLKEGPRLQKGPSFVPASYVADKSPIGAWTPSRDQYRYNRICGAVGPLPCPGSDTGNTSIINPSIFEKFKSTPYGPFSFQFRRYYDSLVGYNYSVVSSSLSVLQPLIMRDDIFAIEGAIVDLSSNPGIGFWNHSLPHVKHGGSWSQDVLWLEPESSCVNTNLTIDYQRSGNDYVGNIIYIDEYNITDRGGFVNLTTTYPNLTLDGQHINLYEHANKGAVIMNRWTLLTYNMPRNESYIGRTIPNKEYNISTYGVGKFGSIPVSSLFNTSFVEEWDSQHPREERFGLDMSILCQGFGGGDKTNLSIVGVQCSAMLGPPERSDGGDPRVLDNATWTQSIHFCSAVTRARIQTIDFALNGTSRSIESLQITRRNTNKPILWAMEKTDLNISDVGVLWGPVADSYENDPTLRTLRSEVFYIPASSSDYWGLIESIPSSMVGAIWVEVMEPLPKFDYSGSNNRALLEKWQALIRADPAKSQAQIVKLLWTELAANNLMGSNTASTVWAVRNEQSILFDLRYGVPGALLLLLWLPTLIWAISLFLIRRLKFSYIRHLLNQTSVGRIVVGDSALRAIRAHEPGEHAAASGSHLDSKSWVASKGREPIVFGPFGPQSNDTPSSERDANEFEGILKSKDANSLPRRRKLTRELMQFLQRPFEMGRYHHWNSPSEPPVTPLSK